MIGLCEHKYEKVKETRRYFDVSGVEVICFWCRCMKCGKQKERKYIGHVVGELFVR